MGSGLSGLKTQSTLKLSSCLILLLRLIQQISEGMDLAKSSLIMIKAE